MARLVEHLTSAQVMISRFVGSSPTAGSVLTARAWSLLRIPCLPLSLSLPPAHVLSKINIFKNLKIVFNFLKTKIVFDFLKIKKSKQTF